VNFVGLEIETNKTAGEEIRRTEAPRPAMAGALILMLTVVEFVLLVLVIQAVAAGWNSPHTVTEEVAAAPFAGILKSDQQIISAWIAGIMFCIAFTALLYQRYFMDHVILAKKRFRKWEDEGVQFE
jgi:hypothetical protein